MVRRNRWIERKKDWSFIKNKVDNDGLILDYEEGRNKVRVFVIEGNTRFFANLFAPQHRFVIGQSDTNAVDYADFVNNYKNPIDTTPPTHPDEIDIFGVGKVGKKIQIHESSRPDTETKRFHTVWTGAGDDMETPALGDSDISALTVTASDSIVVQDFEYHSSFGDTYMHEGYFMWEGAGIGDYVSVSVVAKETPLQTSTNLDYEMDGNKIKAAVGGPGTGTHGLAGTPVLVQKPNLDGYWNYDGVNLTYTLSQDGQYDMYDIEMEVARPVNRVPVNGNSTSYVMFQSADADPIPPGYLVRVAAYNTSQSDWSVWFFMTVYRETMDPIPY